jgi:lysozyme
MSLQTAAILLLESRYLNDQLLVSMFLLPKLKPQQPRNVTESLLKDLESPVTLVGIRGYYSETFAPGGNNINVYDDAMFLISKYGYYPFNANTDPSIRRPRVARLKAGVWQYKLGIHNLNKAKSRQYPALVQAAPVTISRQGSDEETGWFGINIHKGSNTTTSSLGCQTIPPPQWSGFFELVRMEMKRAGVKQIPYVLIDKA